MALEIPHGFGRDLARGAVPEIGVWLDGAMPMRAEVARGYVMGLHAQTLAEGVAAATGSRSAGLGDVAVRYRYNPEMRSLVAMVPAVLPMLLVFIPAIGEYVIPALLGGPDTLMIGRVMWDEFFSSRDWPVASSVAIIMLILVVVPIMWLQSVQNRQEDRE